MDDSTKPVPLSDSGGATPERSSGAWWRLPLLLVVVFAAIIAARNSRLQERTATPRPVAAPQSAADSGKSVSLTIEYGAGRKREFTAVPWHDGMTIDDLMNAATQLPDPISYGVAGDHALTMLTRIDNTYNQWEGGSNWTYKVNDVPGDRSLAIYELRPGDRVLWTFGPRQ
jgi:hypothetical protein